MLPGALSAYTLTLVNPLVDADGGFGPLAPVVITGQRSITGQVMIINPTNVAVVDAGTRMDGEGVHLFWRTQDESNVMGFRLLRRVAGGEASWLTPSVLPAQHPGQPLGDSYHFVDRTRAGTAAHPAPAYVLVILAPDGTQRHIPLDGSWSVWQLFLPQLVLEP